MKPRFIAVLAALALALGFATPASAGTGTNGSLTITATDQVLRSGCYYYQMTYSADAPHWSLQIDVSKPGAWGDSDFVMGDGFKSGLTSAFLCESLDGPGTYTVRAVLTSHDSNYNELPNIETSTTFVLYVPPTAVQRYITHVYSDLFNRAPDPTGMNGWTSALNTGTPRVAVANAITNSTEYRSKLITGSYDKYLARTPDPSGMNTWLAAMKRGFTVSQIEAGFIASPEYFAKAQGTNATWVQKLYTDVLGRSAGPSEVNFWTGRLSAGMSRNQVAMGFLLSAERLGTVVNEYYVQLLGRGLDPSGRATWVRMLQAGGRNETIIGGIIASPEYYAKT